MATASQPQSDPRVPPEGTRMTAGEFMALPDDPRAEFVDGVLVMSPPTGGPRGAVTMRLAGLLTAHVDGRDLGYLFDSSTAFRLRPTPPLVRSPDAAFVPKDRLPGGAPRRPVTVAPALAVEVTSPCNRPGEVARKVSECFRHGCALVWVVDPDDRSGTVHAGGPFPQWTAEGDTLDGGAVLPGFSTPIAALFAGLARGAAEG